MSPHAARVPRCGNSTVRQNTDDFFSTDSAKIGIGIGSDYDTEKLLDI